MLNEKFASGLSHLDWVVSHFTYPEKTGHKYLVCCPCHNDRSKHGKNSLCISQKYGKILFNCFAGCDTEAIIASVGLTWPDLFLENKRFGCGYESNPIIEHYIYEREAGLPLYRICRTKLKKPFIAQKYVGSDDASDLLYEWDDGIKGVRRVPYNLPEVLTSDIIA